MTHRKKNATQKRNASHQITNCSECLNVLLNFHRIYLDAVIQCRISKWGLFLQELVVPSTNIIKSIENNKNYIGSHIYFHVM